VKKCTLDAEDMALDLRWRQQPRIRNF